MVNTLHYMGTHKLMDTMHGRGEEASPTVGNVSIYLGFTKIKFIL